MNPQKAISLIVNNYKKDCLFSHRLAIDNLSILVLSQLRCRNAVRKINSRKDKEIIRLLEIILEKTIEEYKGKPLIHEKVEINSVDSLPIWLCWWTGEENAPPLVKQCIKSIRKEAGTHPVRLITKDNFCHYLNVPDLIINKVNDKTMCLANFSDYLRFSLLEKYGGMWMDVTIFCSQAIPESCFSAPLFSGRLPIKTGDYVSNYEWTSFCFAGYKHHALFRFFKSCFEEYWTGFDYAVDYLLVDYLIYLGKKHLPSVERDLGEIPITNTHRFELQNAMRMNVTENRFSDFLFTDTWLNKLSWHEDYAEFNAQGNKTVYGHFLEMKI